MKDNRPEKLKDRDRCFIHGGGKGSAVDKKQLINLLCRPNCAAELKLLIVAALLLCSLFTLFLQLSPTTTTTTTSTVISASNTPSKVISATDSKSLPPYPPSPQQNGTHNGTLKPNIYAHSNSSLLPPGGTVSRTFQPGGRAAYSFILMSAYRGGPTTFSLIGLASKPLHVFSRPLYTCEYQGGSAATSTFVGGAAILPDWGYGRVYTTVVITCNFPSTSPAGDPSSGGKLLLHAATNGGGDTAVNSTSTFSALEELPGSWRADQFESKETEKYEFMYCGSPLYGDLSPQRIREWMAHHVRLFGRRAHFAIYDAGGVHNEVMEVLKPWIKLGYVTVHDIREQERFDGYYHNQFLVVNDCLHRYRFEAKWMFFFDVDEYIYAEGGTNESLRSVMGLYENFTQITFSQMLMSSKLCRAEDDDGQASKKWGFEKLVFRDIKRVPRRNRKYAVQPRNVFATGVHLSKNFVGESTYPSIKLIRYFHYHETISLRHESCRQFVNGTSAKIGDTPYTLDTTMQSLASKVKDFELATVGSRLQVTQQ